MKNFEKPYQASGKESRWLMNIGFGLNLEQTQKLILTKELKQSLEILQMPTYKLEEVILKESQENPLLEIEKKSEIDWEKYIQNMASSPSNYREYTPPDEDSKSDYENMVKSQTSLYEHLKSQVGFLGKISDTQREIIEFIIDSLDEDGYLKIEDSAIAQRFKEEKSVVEKCITLVQTMEPAGVGARSLEECLLIQLKEQGVGDEVLKSIIKDDLSLIGRKNFKEISKKYSIKMEAIGEYCKIIKTLEPKPGRKYGAYKNDYVLPDVIVEKIGEELVVRLNNNSLPTININHFYKNILTNTNDSETKDYIKEKLNSVANLLKNVESRKNTILKVSMEIVSEQKDFFEKGKCYLKPMTLKDIATKLDFHESTISRAVNGKYMLTPFGLFELKYFFNSAPKDEDLASTSIKKIIKEIIDSENKKKPYSDQKLVDILKSKGISISRRTIAKYRDEMQILSSSRRKEI